MLASDEGGQKLTIHGRDSYRCAIGVTTPSFAFRGVFRRETVEAMAPLSSSLEVNVRMPRDFHGAFYLIIIRCIGLASRQSGIGIPTIHTPEI